MFLTQQEIEQLTGCRQKAAQLRWLGRNGIKFFIRADGAPAVARESVITEATRKAERASGFDLAALDNLE